MIITTWQFEQFLDDQNAKYGFAKDPDYPTGDLQTLFTALLGAHEDYMSLPATSTKDERVLGLQAICTCAVRYLEATRVMNNEFVGRIAGAVLLNKQARRELRPILSEARTRARNNFLKLMPKATADAVKSAKAAQNWDNLKKIHNSEGGKKLNEHYWKEIFDPYHRPPHAVVDYDDLFKRWQRATSPYLDEQGTLPNPEYNPDLRQNFFDILDAYGALPPEHFQYKYLTAAEREGALLIVKAGLLVRKRGGLVFNTDGWELNNGFRNKTYEGSGQSMLRDHGIWVMSPEGGFYSGPQTTQTGDRHHSSFLSGAPVKGGGEWLVRAGLVKVITGSSGHYTPNFAQFQNCLRTLSAAGIDLSTVAAEWVYKTEDAFRYFNAKQLPWAR